MKQLPPSSLKRFLVSPGMKLQMAALLLVTACTSPIRQYKVEEIIFHSGPFKLVGDLRFPEGKGPYPVILFVHGDGPIDRTGGVTYPPIMRRMLQAGYATFAWDKPGTGESTGEFERGRLQEQRAQIVLEAIAVMKALPDIDPQRIGLWGISQGGYVMPRVLSQSDDVAFMIAVSCPGVAGVDQGAYLVSAQAHCAGLPQEQTEILKQCLVGVERAQSYAEYLLYKEQIDAIPGTVPTMKVFGFVPGAKPEKDWKANNLQGEYYWNPMPVIEQTTIPVLAFFAEKDTQIDPVQGAQAYREALQRTGNPNVRIEFIPGADHNMIISETGCIEERNNRSRKEWTNYAPEYLDTLEAWLKELRP